MSYGQNYALIRGAERLRSPKAHGQRIPGGTREPTQTTPKHMPPPRPYGTSFGNRQTRPPCP